MGSKKNTIPCSEISVEMELGEVQIEAAQALWYSILYSIKFCRFFANKCINCAGILCGGGEY